MKSGVFLVALVGVFAVISGDLGNEECPLMKALKESINACIDKLSEESFKLLEADKFADNEEIRCFRACIMTHSGIMSDAKIDFVALDEILSKKTEHAEESRKIVDTMKSCKLESETSDNECEVAGNYAKCFQAKKGE